MLEKCKFQAIKLQSLETQVISENTLIIYFKKMFHHKQIKYLFS